MPVLKYPIGILTLFLVFGIITGHYLNSAPFVVYLFTCIGFAVLAFAFWQSKSSLLPRPYFTIAALLFSFTLGMLTQSLHYAANQKLHYSHFTNKEDTVITGTISERLKPGKHGERYYFKVTSVNRRISNGRILLTSKKLFHAGDALIITQAPAPITKSLNPYQFDYADYMAKQGILHQVWLKDNYLYTATEKNFDYYLGNLRNNLTHSFAMHHYSPEIQHTLDALLLGQRQDMETEINEAYKNAGVLHILAISGLHFSVLFYLLTLIFNPLRRLPKHGKLIRLASILVIIWGFAFITGLSASVVRSVVMFTIICIGQYLDRDTNIYNSLCISMLLLLVANPYFIFDAGFQLSYLAVFAIVWLEPFYKQFRLSKYRAVNYFSDTVLVSLAAQLGVLPLSIYYFNRFPLLFLIANLVVIPLSNIILVLGLLVLCLNFIWADAALITGKLLGFLVEMMNGFIGWIASFESVVLSDIPFTLLLTVLLYSAIASFGFWLYKKSFKRTVAALCSILLFQMVYSTTAWQHRNSEELIIFYNKANTLLTLKTADHLSVMSNDSLSKYSQSVITYSRTHFNPKLQSQPVQNTIWFKGRKILLIDNPAAYSVNMKPDVLILANSPKVNLERLVRQLQPKIIIADGTNYKSRIKLWQATCHKQKTPFHATAEKGFYTLK